MTADIQFVFPPMADETDPLEFGLISLTQVISRVDPDLLNHGALGGEFGYGAHWESDVFLMHPYCWCDREGECPWCTGCNIYQERGDCRACEDEGSTLAERRAAPAELCCDYVAGRGIFSRFAPLTLDHSRGYYDPPNFWHKPSGLRVVWYKWIGRNTYTNRDVTREELQAIFAECVGNLTTERRTPFWFGAEHR